MPVVDAGFVPAPPPRHRLDELAPVVDLDVVGVLAGLDRVADETGRHRVGLAAHLDGAPAPHPGRVGGVARQRLGRQRPQRRALERQAVSEVAVVAPVDDGADKAGVGLERVEGRTAAQHQGLREGALGAVTPLLDDPVLVGRAGLDAGRAQPVVLEHGLEPGRQRPAPGRLERVRGGREVVGAHDLGRPTQRPQRPLQPRDQGLERFAEGHRHPGPATEAEDELEEQMPQRRPLDRHPQIGGVGEVEGGLSAGLMNLGEVDLARGPLQGAPVTHPTLERPHLPGGELPGEARLELGQERGGLEDAPGIPLQQRDHRLVPHLGERVRSGTPRPNPRRVRGQRASLPGVGGPDTHPGGRGGGVLRRACAHLLPQQPDLRVGEHRGPPGPPSMSRRQDDRDRQE